MSTREDLACPQCGPGYRFGDEGCQHEPRSSDKPAEQRLAAAREVLNAKIKDAFYAARDAGRTMHQAADDAVDAILSSGVLVDADEVRREEWRHVHSIDVDGVCQDCERLAGEGGNAVYEQGKVEGRAKLQAAIEALADEWGAADPNEPNHELWRSLRALVADGGADALEAVKRKAWFEGHRDECGHTNRVSAVFCPRNPYGTDSKEDG